MRTTTHVTVTELWGDGIGPELREAVHAVAGELPVEVRFEPVDLSLENRERRGKDLFDEAEAAIRTTRLALKYPTETRDESPNAILRRRLALSVIHRPVMSMVGVESNFKEPVALHIVRVATGGTYDDPGQLIGPDTAVSLRIVERRPCREASQFAFELARRESLSVTSASKHTIQRVTDGLFESEVAGVAVRFRGIEHRVELFDALLARLALEPRRYQVVLCLNEYGDFLSDLACGLAGSLGIGASAGYAFDPGGRIELGLFDPAGGTAPDIAGLDHANPTAALLAFAMLLEHAGSGREACALRQSLLELIAEGTRTRDLGGREGTRSFTTEVCSRLARHLP